MEHYFKGSICAVIIFCVFRNQNIPNIMCNWSFLIWYSYYIYPFSFHPRTHLLFPPARQQLFSLWQLVIEAVSCSVKRLMTACVEYAWVSVCVYKAASIIISSRATQNIYISISFSTILRFYDFFITYTLNELEYISL